MNSLIIYAGYTIAIRYAGGDQYVITKTPAGYAIGGITFATISAALVAIRTARRKAARA